MDHFCSPSSSAYYIHSTHKQICPGSFFSLMRLLGLYYKDSHFVVCKILTTQSDLLSPTEYLRFALFKIMTIESLLTKGHLSPDSCSQAVSYMCSETHLSLTQELFLQLHTLFSPPHQTSTLLNHLHQQVNMLSNHPSIKSKKRGTFLDLSRPSITGLLGLLFPITTLLQRAATAVLITPPLPFTPQTTPSSALLPLLHQLCFSQYNHQPASCQI